jgi:ADP-ribose pyrophosphatase YjhB (NUDIX family)
VTEKRASNKGADAHQPTVAVFVVIFTVHEQGLKVLLIRRGGEPFKGWWAIPGGRLGTDETLDEAAARKLVEETGVRDVYLEQLYTFGDLDKTAPTGAVAIGYFALVNYGSVSLPEREDWPTAWFSIGDLPELAFNNKDVLDYALRRLRYKLEYTNVAYSLLPPYFTMSQLQTVYESIAGKKLDKRNFRKRVLAMGIVKPTEKTVLFGAHRPAKLYTFSSRQPQTI